MELSSLFKEIQTFISDQTGSEQFSEYEIQGQNQRSNELLVSYPVKSVANISKHILRILILTSTEEIYLSHQLLTVK